jgi:hypothetical protein
VYAARDWISYVVAATVAAVVWLAT